MNRKLEMVGVAVAAILAMSAITATAALAESGKLTADGPVKLTGTTTSGVARAFGFSIECHQHATIGKVNETPQGFVTPPLSTFTVQTESTNCVATLGATKAPATVMNNGCDAVTQIGETISAGKWSGTTEIVCPEGKQIEVRAYTNSSHTSTICTVKIPAQSGLKGGFAENAAGGKINLSGAGGGIKATKTGILCGGNAETNNAELEGTAVVSGTNEKGAATEIALSD
jgi:hypothetical protein